MKKRLAFIIALMMIFSLCACDYMDEVVVETVTPDFDLSVNFETSEDEAALENGTVVFRQSIANTLVSSEKNHDAARKINKALETLHKELSDASAEIKTAALAQSDDDAVIYEYTVSAEVLRCDTNVLSIGYSTYSFSGGAHGLYSLRTMNFDAESGELLTIDSISTDSEKFRSFLVNYMISLAGDEEYMLNGERVIDDDDRLSISLPQLLDNNCWYFDESSLVIFANPYDIAPYAAGIVKFSIPYSTLAEFLDAKLMPVPLEGDAGIILAEDGEACDRDRLDILDCITLDEDAQSVILSAEDTVYNVKLYCENAFDTDDGNTSRVYLWNRNYLSSREAIEIISFIPDVSPLVYVEYTLADGTVITRGIFQSGEDGSIILVEPLS